MRTRRYTPAWEYVDTHPDNAHHARARALGVKAMDRRKSRPNFACPGHSCSLSPSLLPSLSLSLSLSLSARSHALCLRLPLYCAPFSWLRPPRRPPPLFLTPFLLPRVQISSFLHWLLLLLLLLCLHVLIYGARATCHEPGFITPRALLLQQVLGGLQRCTPRGCRRWRGRRWRGGKCHRRDAAGGRWCRRRHRSSGCRRGGWRGWRGHVQRVWRRR